MIKHKHNKAIAGSLALAVMLTTATITVHAEVDESPSESSFSSVLTTENTESGADIGNDETAAILQGRLRTSRNINWSIAANTAMISDTNIWLSSGSSITLNLTISPASSNADIGIYQPDGTFRFINVTNGSGNHTFAISVSGNYKVRVRNNSGFSITAAGAVTY